MDTMITVDVSSIPGAGYGAWSTTTIPVNTVFGPNNADPDIDIEEGSSLLSQIKKELPEDLPEFKPDIENIWMRHINCARDKTEENLIAFHHKGALFYRVSQTIPAKTELLVDACKRNTCWKQHMKLTSNCEENKLSDVNECKPSISYNQCEDNLSTPNNLHVHNIQTKDELFKCDVCGKKYAQRPYLECHMRVHIGEAVRRLSHLRSHNRLHTEEKPHKCNLCEMSFSRMNNLKQHNMVHTGEKPHECNYCGKSFRQLSHLRKHIRVHTGEKPYKCNHCGKSFGHLSSLKKHNRVHTGDKPHKCNQCGNSFGELSNLRRHIRSHTGEKSHECNNCGYSFAELSDLRKHNCSIMIATSFFLGAV